jgi:hypothetical protein
MASETFSPQGYLLPDWGAAKNWTGGTVPGAGTSALVNAHDAYIDPQTTLLANITLEGGGGLIGNDGGWALGAAGTVVAEDQNLLNASGAIVNQGVIAADGPGAVLSVVVEAGGQIAQTYGLAAPSFENAGTVVVTGGGTLDISGTEFSNTGTVIVNDGVLAVTGGWVDGGQGALIPGGTIEMSRGGQATFSDGVIDQTFDFFGPGTITLGDSLDSKADAVAGFGYRDEILTGSVAQAESLIHGGLDFTTPLPAGYTLAVSATAGGAEIFAAYDETAPPCFARGTRILSPSGYINVEHLKPGDRVATVAGGVRMVRWVGRRTIDLQTHRRPQAVWPICITANALADGVPVRDLFLSPDHALLLRGKLVPVKLLVNGATIRRDRNCLAVTYYHIELDRHEVVIAENLGAETYIDTGNRGMFESTEGKPWANPVFGRGKQWDSAAYAELCLSGPVLRAIRTEIFNRVLAMGFRQRVSHDVTLLVDGQKIPRGFGVASLPCFRLEPGHSGIVAIRSASFVPAELSGGATFEDDWRSLGVAIRRIKLGLRSVGAAEIARSGFYPRGEHDIADWTDGNGVISVASDTTVIGLNISALPRVWQAPMGALSRE